MIIHAPSVHVGGGKVLLDHLLTQRAFGPISALFVDTRYEVPNGVENSLTCFRIKPTLLARLRAELQLRKLAIEHPETNLLCFANLPPLFRLPNHTILFLQNALLIPGISLSRPRLKVQMRLLYERLWSRLNLKNIDELWVQTEAMRGLLANTSMGIPIRVRPIHPVYPAQLRSQNPRHDFVMVSSHGAHKRQQDYLHALLQLALDGYAFSAVLVTDGVSHEQASLIEKIDRIAFHRRSQERNQVINFELLKGRTREDVFGIFANSRILINTSELESFCLPLYEAQAAGLKIITCHEPYALEAVSANECQTFETRKWQELASLMKNALSHPALHYKQDTA